MERIVTRKGELKLSYNNNYILLMTLGMVWLASAALGTSDYPNLAILMLFLGITLFKPFLKMARKCFGIKSCRSGESVKMFTTCMSIGIPFGLVAGFFPFQENINMFFPAFSLLFSLLFLIIAWVFRVVLFGLTGLFIMAGGIYIMMNHQDSFTLAGFYTGAVITVLAMLSRTCNEVILRIRK